MARLCARAHSFRTKECVAPESTSATIARPFKVTEYNGAWYTAGIGDTASQRLGDVTTDWSAHTSGHAVMTFAAGDGVVKVVDGIEELCTYGRNCDGCG